MKIGTFSNIALAVLLIVLFPSLHNAHAYLDPGSGSYALQVGAALFFTGVYGVKIFWKRITTKIKGLGKRKEP